MKKLSSLAMFLFICLFSFNTFAAVSHGVHSKTKHSQASEGNVNLYFFWSKDCPHCVAAHPFIDKLKAEYPWLKVTQLEISGNPHNSRLFEKMARAHGKETSFVPTFFVGNRMIVGYTSPETTGAEIRNAVIENHDKKTKI